MVLDATALSALEVVETLEGTYKGSLLHFLDNTSTGSGYRLLKQWVCAPLYDASEIRSRQEVIEFLIQHKDCAQHVSTGLKQIPIDLERVTARVWSFALQSERHAVMYDDVTSKRLLDFMCLLKSYKQAIELVTKAFPAGQALPSRLARIVRTEKEGGVFPDLNAIIDKLCSSVVESTDPKNGRPKCRPQAGADAEHDKVTQKIDQTKRHFDNEVSGLKSKHPGANFTYMHRLPGFRYEIECDEKSVPAAFLNTVDVTQRKHGKVRFYTPRTKQLLAQLEAQEDEQGDCIFPFLSRLFQAFHGHQARFRATVRCLAELDAMLSLAAASNKLTGSSCSAEIVEPSSAEASGLLELHECRHPVAAGIMGNAFVPNDTVMNANAVPGVLVVTGPNMGGKSTVLRQTCIAVVMAQLGCRVNAKSCRLSPVDRIFTRIGSYDTILEGKSTLLIELEETAAVITHGSRRSLAVLDELGRGTSTYDGAAIASAVLDEMAHRVGCMVLFATHYHPVSRAASKKPEVAPFHMAASIDGHNQMTFLYRFLPGLCPASYGHNVARLAGLPASVLEDALARSAEFEQDEAAELEQLAEAKDVLGLRRLYKRLHSEGKCAA
jgi:DNA mismatch repair protein MSH6